MKRSAREASVAEEPLVQGERRTLLARLVGGAIHELNNPLSVLLGQATLLRRAVGSDPALGARADRISEAADRCARIVRSFVRLSDPPGDPEPVDLDRVVRETLELLAHGLRSRGIGVKFDAGASFPVWAAPQAVRELVAHLVLSAEPALEEAPHPRGMEVRTGLAAKPQTLELRVALSAGLGWAPAPPSREERGSLSVSRFLAAAIGGRFESGNEGGGNARVVWIPAAGPIPAAPSRPGERRVLVVPGREEFAAFVGEVLAGSGHACSPSPSEAPSAEERSGFDVVVVDADRAGLDLVAWVAEGPGKLVVLAGDALPIHVARLLREAGVQIVRKPVDPDELLGAVARSGL